METTDLFSVGKPCPSYLWYTWRVLRITCQCYDLVNVLRIRASCVLSLNCDCEEVDITVNSSRYHE